MYPYRLDSKAPATITFYGMSGVGYPPHDVGYPGDIYIDNNTDSPAIWAMIKLKEDDTRQWVKWLPTDEARIGHPHLKFRYLWGSTRGEVSWYSPSTFEALLKQENPGGRRTAGELVAEMLRANTARKLNLRDTVETDQTGSLQFANIRSQQTQITSSGEFRRISYAVDSKSLHV